MAESHHLSERQLERLEGLLERFPDDRLARVEAIADKLPPERLAELERMLDMQRAMKVLWMLGAVLLGPFILSKAVAWTAAFFEFLGRK